MSKQLDCLKFKQAHYKLYNISAYFFKLLTAIGLSLSQNCLVKTSLVSLR